LELRLRAVGELAQESTMALSVVEKTVIVLFLFLGTI
jgi:hypothetical protein